MAAKTRYDLYYWPGLQGRGEFVRLALEEGGAQYRDVVRLPKEKGGGVDALMKELGRADGEFSPFAPPVLKVGNLVISHTALILQFLGPRLGLAPASEKARLQLWSMQLTVTDLAAEIHDVHHPIAVSLYYEDQKAEAKRRAGHLIAERLPKYLGYFESVLGKRKNLVGRSLTTVDLSMFQVMAGLDYAFPRAMAKLKKKLPGLVALAERVAARPRIAAYLASPRRIPFNEHGLFRSYPELDQPK